MVLKRFLRDLAPREILAYGTQFENNRPARLFFYTGIVANTALFHMVFSA
jgi:hypothetical protein